MKTIAVVEDNADNRLLLQSLLGDTYLITEYEDGPEALAGLRRHPSLRDLPVIAPTAHRR